MALYNTPLEPGLILGVNTSSLQNQVTVPQGLNVCYLLTEQPALGTLTPNKPNLVTNLTDYRNRIGGVPVTYPQLVDYLSVSAFFDNANGAGLLQVIPVKTPSDISTLAIAAITGTYSFATYTFSVNGVVIQSTVNLSGLPATYNAQIASDLALKIQASPTLNSVIYIRQVTTNTVEIAPYVTGTILNFSFAIPGIIPALTYGVLPADYTYTLSTPANGAPSVTDYGQSLYTAITEDKELGYIIAPGFFASNTTLTGLALANLFDVFCRGAKRQHLAFIDVPNPDFANIPLYSSLATYDSGQALAAAALVRFNGNIYVGAGAGITLTPAATAATVLPVGGRYRLPSAITYSGTTTKVLQSINATAAIAVLASPTALELQKFVPIPDSLIISESLSTGRLRIQEQSSSTESGLYNWRDSFNSVEGHVSVAAPYQLYSGLQVSQPYVIPASAYFAALAIRVADLSGLSAPPASDQYPLLSTAGSVWQVTSPGHALLNGKGINVIKTINGQVYLMGSRTLSLVDLYNRLNNRQILSAYIRTMTLALNQGIVLRALDSTGTQLAAVKTQMDRVSEAFYRAKLFDGVTSGDAYQNVCSNLNNNITDLQRGVVRAESIVVQIGLLEQLRVTITETLLGS